MTRLMERHDPQLSRRMEHLKLAAAAAREEADQMLRRASGSLRSTSSIAPRILGTVSGKTLRVAAGVVRRHPVSAALIASVLVGTVIYHLRHTQRGDGRQQTLRRKMS